MSENPSPVNSESYTSVAVKVGKTFVTLYLILGFSSVVQRTLLPFTEHAMIKAFGTAEERPSFLYAGGVILWGSIQQAFFWEGVAALVEDDVTTRENKLDVFGGGLIYGFLGSSVLAVCLITTRSMDPLTRWILPTQRSMLALQEKYSLPVAATLAGIHLFDYIYPPKPELDTSNKQPEAISQDSVDEQVVQA